MFFKSTILWSSIYLFVVFAVSAGFFTSCGNESEIANPQEEKEIGEDLLSDNEFLKQSVAFVDARVRSISEIKYVREVVLINFAEENRMPSTLIFDGTTFFDDGCYNDLQANDGIYASAAEFGHSERLPYDREQTVKSVMEQIVIDHNFQYADRIEDIANIYSKPANSKGIVKAEDRHSLGVAIITLDCDIEFNTCGCRADRWGWCNCCCFSLTNCHIVLEVGW